MKKIAKLKYANKSKKELCLEIDNDYCITVSPYTVTDKKNKKGEYILNKSNSTIVIEYSTKSEYFIFQGTFQQLIERLKQ
jgi:hypothetical protein